MSDNLPVAWAPDREEFQLSSTLDPKRTLQVIDEATQLSLHVGQTIRATDLVAHTVEVADPKTGELTKALRIIIVGDDGESYASVSKGVLSSLRRIVSQLGPPAEWPEGGLALKIVQKPAKIGHLLTVVPA